jgi:hypothetical protein
MKGSKNMTAKRHSKLIRALVTKIYEKGKEDGTILVKNDMYECVRLAKNGFIPKGYTRAEWWKAIAPTLRIYGMNNIREFKNF